MNYLLICIELAVGLFLLIAIPPLAFVFGIMLVMGLFRLLSENQRIKYAKPKPKDVEKYLKY